MSLPSSGSMTDSRTAITSSRVGGGGGHDADFTGPGPCNLVAVAVSPGSSPLRRRCRRRDVLRVLGRQHPLRHLPGAGPLAPPAGHGRDRRDARPAPQHRPPAPRSDARGRAARGHHRRPRRGRAAAAPLLAGRRRPVARARAADDADARPDGAGDGPAPRRQPGRRRGRRRGRGRGAGRRATTTPRRRSRRSSPTSTGSASTRSSPTAATPTAPTSDAVTAVVAFANCPFADLARAHPDLVCGLHRGLVAGFVAQMGDAEVVEFCSLAHRTPCQVAVTSR